MKIKAETINCDFENHFLINEMADSKILLTLEMAKIASVQSKKRVKDEVINLIKSELKKFKWIITGSVLVDFVWYLNAIERQETDKIGDIDNISKPIQDALIGPNGVLVDDAQIGGLYSYWMSRNELVSDNILKIEIKFNNDYVLLKKNLKFIQYDKAICMPLNIDYYSIKSLFTTKLLIHSKRKIRKLAKISKDSGVNVDGTLIRSEWDFHKSRLNGFDRNDILTIDEFNKICLERSLTFSELMKMIKKTAKK